LEEARNHVFINIHDYAQIIEVTVICRREDCNEVSTSEELESIFLHLVSSANQVKIILLVEVFDDELSESV